MRGRTYAGSQTVSVGTICVVSSSARGGTRRLCGDCRGGAARLFCAARRRRGSAAGGDPGGISLRHRAAAVSRVSLRTANLCAEHSVLAHRAAHLLGVDLCRRDRCSPPLLCATRRGGLASFCGACIVFHRVIPLGGALCLSEMRLRARTLPCAGALYRGGTDGGTSHPLVSVRRGV